VDVPIFGINYGHVGFLQNPADEKRDLRERITGAEMFAVKVLRADITFVDGSIRTEWAVNEAFIFNRRRTETIHLKITVDGKTHCEKLEGDGVIVATAIGSSAYSRSAGGNIMSLARDALIVTPVLQYYRGNKLDPYIFDPCTVEVEVLCPEFRPAGITIDTKQINKSVRKVKLYLDPKKNLKMLFDPGYDRHERALRASSPAPAP
jgi:NAD+ kinase